MDLSEACKELGFNRHILSFTSTVKLDDPGPTVRTIEKLYNLLQEKLSEWTVTLLETRTISVESVEVKIEEESNDQRHKKVLVTWSNQDEDLGAYILGLLQNM